MSYIVLDLETGTKEEHGRKGNPWYNQIVAVGWKYHENLVQSDYLYDGQTDVQEFFQSGLEFFSDEIEFTEIFTGFFSEELLKEFFERHKNLLCNVRVLVGHNIKYDLLYLWKYEALQEWLEQGGKIFDTQLAEYIISGQRHKYPALRDIAVNKYGLKEREKKMEEYWDKGIDTKDIPKELVLEDVQNDVLDTEQVMLQQIKILKKENQFELAMEMMEGLLYTIEAEYNGLYINQDIMYSNKKQLEQEIEELKQQAGLIAEKYWR